MKRLLFFFFMLVGVQAWGQVDTLEFTTRRAVADKVFGLLNQSFYGASLIDRSLTEDSMLVQQLAFGNYSTISSSVFWMQSFSDIALSYVDSTYMYNDSILISKLERFYYENNEQDTNTVEEIISFPLGLLLHNVSRIDSSLYKTEGAFSNLNSQIKLNSSLNENTIYNKVVLKNAAIVDLSPDNGYEKGMIVYDSTFISTSPDITVNSMELNLGYGYVPFSNTNNKILFSIQKDWQIASLIVSYSLNNTNKTDTLSFYLTTIISKFSEDEKSTDRWDTDTRKFELDGETQLKYRIKFGCGNGDKIRRPVLIAPPYRPWIQNPTFKKYYDQFDFKSLISSLSDMGYDVIFIKETPGNRAIDDAGNVLAEFIKFINQQKKENYPYEDWENILIGFSAGGQHWRYALKKMEKEHMESGSSHHHCRLYIPFDSPHWGANVPMFTQAVYKDLNFLNVWASLTYISLKDDASKDMLMNHILGSTIVSNGSDRIITPNPTSEFLDIKNQMENNFNHQFTPLYDLRKSFPTFTRNVAISLGSNEFDYESEELYSLNPGMTLFTQNFFAPSLFGFKVIDRSISSSWYTSNASVFKHKDIHMVGFIVPVMIHKHYKTNYAYEWDMAQGGYKDEFYDGVGWPVDGFDYPHGIPLGPVPILKSTQFFNTLGILLGTQHYTGHMEFLPLVSSLGINPTIWQNNNLYYNVKDEGLMYQSKFDFDNDFRSNTFGYPNLGHPTNHFQITPFEAVYCDPQTYQHIKMQESVEDDGLDDVYLVHTRNFILDEVESDVVYLQNRIIGKNHVQWNPYYRYKAWYKAYQDIVVGELVSPKTDKGPFTIEKTGDITMYACHEVNLKPGFSSEAGSSFHAYVHCDGCSRPRETKSNTSTQEEQTTVKENNELYFTTETNKSVDAAIQVYPNPTNATFTVVFPSESGTFVLTNMNGIVIEKGEISEESRTKQFTLTKGSYIIKHIDQQKVNSKKIIVL